MSELALRTATTYGFAVFPVHTPTEFGCSCGDANCTNIGKHPANNNGCSGATNDPQGIKNLWNNVPSSNYGIATGPSSNIFVIDIDGEKGRETISNLESKYGKLPSTLTVNTGKGKHLYFKYPDRKVKTRKDVFGPGVDVRGEGGYVVGPGSMHASGAIYEFVNLLEETAIAPEWALEIACGEKVTEEPEIKSNGLNLQAANRNSIIYKGPPEWTESQIREMLNYISPDIGYDEWVHIGMAIRDYGLPFTVWDDWSRGGVKYRPQEMASKWNSFRGSGISIGTLVKMAKDKGFVPYLNHDIGATYAGEFDEETGEVFEEKTPVNFTPFEDVEPRLDTFDFVEDLLCDQQFSVFYGPPKSGKTFFVTDLAMHVAQGKQWRDKEVEQGAVVYCALEGMQGIRNRISAFKKFYKLQGQKLPFAIITEHIDLWSSKTDAERLNDVCKQVEDHYGLPVKLTVVDTLARALAGGNENASEDMGRLVKHADYFREISGSAFGLIHHSGKDIDKGMRGHSSLLGAVDTVIQISRTDNIGCASVETQRELETGEKFYFELETVNLGVNQRDKAVTSCVVLSKTQPENIQSKNKLTPLESKSLEILTNTLIEKGKTVKILRDMPECHAVSRTEFREALMMSGVTDRDKDGTERKQWQRIREALVSKGEILMHGEYLWRP